MVPKAKLTIISDKCIQSLIIVKIKLSIKPRQINQTSLDNLLLVVFFFYKYHFEIKNTQVYFLYQFYYDIQSYMLM